MQRKIVATIALTAAAGSLAQPVISRQPMNQSVSLGATVEFQVTVRRWGLHRQVVEVVLVHQ